MPWDSVDRPRDEDRVETCACCGQAAAVREHDPRLPNLAVASCWGCRDQIAHELGWGFFSLIDGGSQWRKSGEMLVTVPNRPRQREFWRAAA